MLFLLYHVFPENVQKLIILYERMCLRLCLLYTSSTYLFSRQFIDSSDIKLFLLYPKISLCATAFPLSEKFLRNPGFLLANSFHNQNQTRNLSSSLSTFFFLLTFGCSKNLPLAITSSRKFCTSLCSSI